MERIARLTLEQINGLSQEEFMRVLGGVFEASPWIAAAAWHERPFASVHALHQTMCEVVDNSTDEQKEMLIRAHPDLVGEAARRGTLTRESAQEQASAGLDHLSSDEVARFTELNKEYREKFGFPFVVCVRENKKQGILAGFATRIHNTREQEVAAALDEIAKIAWWRIEDIAISV